MRSNSQERRRATLHRVVVAWLAIAGLTAGAAWAAEKPATFEFSQFNRSYTDMATDIAPIEFSGIQIQLDSPRHQMTVHSNRLVLTPLADGSYEAELSLRFSGQGDLLADIMMGAVPSRLEDYLVVPEQTRVIRLRARLARSAEGYLVTTETMPEAMEVDIESRVAGQMVSLCRQVGLLLGLRCGPLEQALHRIDVPLPEAGETYLVELAQVGAEGVRQLDAYLGFTPPPPADAASTP